MPKDFEKPAEELSAGPIGKTFLHSLSPPLGGGALYSPFFASASAFSSMFPRAPVSGATNTSLSPVRWWERAQLSEHTGESTKNEGVGERTYFSRRDEVCDTTFV